MKWTKFTGQKLETGDILWTDSGLAFVDSAYTTGEPSRISSIPESWSFTFENNGIHQRTSEGESEEWLEDDGKYYSMWKRKINHAGQILYVCRLKNPLL